jgi:hypothetical protein
VSFSDDLFPDGRAVIIPWCKRCEAGTPSKRCEECGGENAAYAKCGRCPACDGPLQAAAG